MGWYGVPKPGIFWYAVPCFYIACGTQRTVFLHCLRYAAYRFLFPLWYGVPKAFGMRVPLWYVYRFFTLPAVRGVPFSISIMVRRTKSIWYARTIVVCVPFFYIACGTQRTVFYFHFGTAYQKHLVCAYHCGMCTVFLHCLRYAAYRFLFPFWYGVPKAFGT